MADGIDPTPYSNPARTEEITVAGGSGLGGGLLAGLSGVVLVAGLVSGWPTFLVIGAVVTAALGIVLVVRGVTESRHWEPITVHFAHTLLPLGSSSTVTIERRSRKTIPDSAQHDLNVTLKCTEWVQYSVGTDTRTDTAEVFERVFPVRGSIRANTYVGEFDLEIPVDRGGPTLDLRSNKVSWLLEIELSPISTVGGDKDVELTVSPVLDRRHMQFVDAPPPPGPQDA